MAEEQEELNSQLQETGRSAIELTQNFHELQEQFNALSSEGKSFSRRFQSEMTGAMHAVVIEGGSLKDSLKSLAITMADHSFEQALAPAMKGLSVGLTSLLPFAKGGVIEHGQLRAFASGGVVNNPTYFPMESGVGLMGENGAEAILPLQRGSDGKLGLQQTAARSAVNITMNISTRDADGFRKSQSQIASQLQSAMAGADR